MLDFLKHRFLRQVRHRCPPSLTELSWRKRWDFKEYQMILNVYIEPRFLSANHVFGWIWEFKTLVKHGVFLNKDLMLELTKAGAIILPGYATECCLLISTHAFLDPWQFSRTYTIRQRGWNHLDKIFLRIANSGRQEESENNPKWPTNCSVTSGRAR